MGKRLVSGLDVTLMLLFALSVERPNPQTLGASTVTLKRVLIRSNVKPSDVPKEPWCYYPETHGYVTSNTVEKPSGITVDIVRNPDFPSQRSQSRDIDKLRVEITYLSGQSLQWKIFDPANARYEVPVPLDLPAAPEAEENNRLYGVQIQHKPFGSK